jgi:hypothetical protein
MNNTKEIENKMHEVMMSHSGAERLIMGARMFDAWRATIIASLPTDLAADEFKRVLFERIYGKPLEDFLEHPSD